MTIPSSGLFERGWLRVELTRKLIALVVFVSLAAPGPVSAQQTPPPDEEEAAAAPATATASAELSAEHLQSLVAPIALYPDELLAQVLVASTYPLEIIQLHQWLERHPDLEGQALADSVALQPWDASIQSMAAVPEAVERLAEDIQWTTELGNAFLAQQSDAMDAVQAMRQAAQAHGSLESNEQQTVETQTVENVQVIVIESSDPEIIYVPSYAPMYVYPPPIYPYPPIYYPPYYPGTAFITFSVGFAMGAAMWGGSCCHAGWGGNNIYINNDNNFNDIDIDRGDRNQINTGERGQGDRGQGGGGDSWQHDPSHRGGTPYADKATADRYGGSTRPSAGTTDGRGQAGGAGVSNRAAGGAAGGAAGASAGTRPAGADRPAAPGSSDRSAGAGAGSGPGVSDRSGGGSGESIGNRSVPNGSPSSGLSGGSRGYSGSSARASSSRGGSSMGGRRGGGRRR